MLVRRAAVAVLLALVPACAGADRALPEPAPTPTPSPRPLDPFELAASYLAPDPQALATRLVAAERAIVQIGGAAHVRSGGHLPGAGGDGDVAEHARVQQAAYRQLVAEPSWRDEVLAAVPDDLLPAVRANLAAGVDLRALTSPRPGLPDWEIVAPPPADELRAHYGAAEQEFGVSWSYLAAIHLVETRMGRIRGTSTAGARGPMQFLPSTWEHWGEGDIEDPRDAIRAAARYLVGHGAPADMDRALYAYNHSQRYVRAVSAYAGRMRAEPATYAAYYHWQVYYRTTRGDALLDVGWRG